MERGRHLRVIASVAKQSSGLRGELDCFVAPLLAMTRLAAASRFSPPALRRGDLRHGAAGDARGVEVCGQVAELAGPAAGQARGDKGVGNLMRRVP